MVSNQISIDKIPQYSDVTNHITGENVKIASIVDIPIVIWRITIRDSIYRKVDNDPDKEYMQIEFSYESNLSEKFVTSTSSYYLIDDIRSIQNSLPVRAKVVRKELHRRDPNGPIKYAYILN